MAISVVSNPNLQNDEDITTSSQTTQQGNNGAAVGFGDDTQQNNTETTTNNADNTKQVSQSWENTVPNLYIQADQKQVQTVPSKPTNTPPENREQQSEGFDMDDLLGDETTISDQNTAKKIHNDVQTPEKTDTSNLDLFAQSTDTKADKTATTQEKQIKNTAKTTKAAIQNTAKQTSKAIKPKQTTNKLIKWLAFAAMWCFVILILWFVVKTMFPLGMWTSNDTEWELVAIQDTGENMGEENIQEDIDVEHSADTKTEAELVMEQLEEYAALSESFYELGRDLQDRDIVRFALYIEKRSKDFIDELASDPDMDTKNIVVYFPQFDEYLQTVEEVAVEKSNGNTMDDDNDDNDSPSDTFVPMIEQDNDTTNNQTGTTTGSELSELSNW